jgi:hypothetical protein
MQDVSLLRIGLVRHAADMGRVQSIKDRARQCREGIEYW